MILTLQHYSLKVVYKLGLKLFISLLADYTDKEAVYQQHAICYLKKE